MTNSCVAGYAPVNPEIQALLDSGCVMDPFQERTLEHIPAIAYPEIYGDHPESVLENEVDWEAVYAPDLVHLINEYLAAEAHVALTASYRLKYQDFNSELTMLAFEQACEDHKVSLGLFAESRKALMDARDPQLAALTVSQLRLLPGSAAAYIMWDIDPDEVTPQDAKKAQTIADLHHKIALYLGQFEPQNDVGELISLLAGYVNDSALTDSWDAVDWLHYVHFLGDPARADIFAHLSEDKQDALKDIWENHLLNHPDFVYERASSDEPVSVSATDFDTAQRITNELNARSYRDMNYRFALFCKTHPTVGEAMMEYMLSCNDEVPIEFLYGSDLVSFQYGH